MTHNGPTAAEPTFRFLRSNQPQNRRRRVLSQHPHPTTRRERGVNSRGGIDIHHAQFGQKKRKANSDSGGMLCIIAAVGKGEETQNIR